MHPLVGELIHELVLALDLSATYERIAQGLHVRPTQAEAVNPAIDCPLSWLVPDNDQVHRAGGTIRVNFEKSKTLNEGNDVEKPKREPTPVQRLVMHH